MMMRKKMAKRTPRMKMLYTVRVTIESKRRGVQTFVMQFLSVDACRAFIHEARKNPLVVSAELEDFPTTIYGTPEQALWSIAFALV
jgi:hypothetical protein